MKTQRKTPLENDTKRVYFQQKRSSQVVEFIAVYNFARTAVLENYLSKNLWFGCINPP